MARRHQHQQQQSNNITHLHSQPKKGVMGLFTREKDELFIIDYVTPHTSLRCAIAGCDARDVIPLTGYCIEHDPLCRAIVLARVFKAEEDAKKALPAVVKRYGTDPQDNLPFDPYGFDGVGDVHDWYKEHMH